LNHIDYLKGYQNSKNHHIHTHLSSKSSLNGTLSVIFGLHGQKKTTR
jgi:hypothetical protein